MSLYLGIDFGTCNIYITKWDSANNKAEPVPNLSSYASKGNDFPNVIFYEKIGNPVVGDVACEKKINQFDSVVSNVKRKIPYPDWRYQIKNTNKSLSAKEITQDIFRYIINKVEEKNGAVDGVVIGIPYTYHFKEQNIIKEAAIAAGLNVIALIEEPVAAALGFGIFNQNFAVGTKERIMIFDLGGSKVDVTIFEFCNNITGNTIEVLNTYCSALLGGNDIDELLKNRIVDIMKIPIEEQNPKEQSKILTVAKEIKEYLSDNNKYEGYLHTFYNRDFEETITTDEFNAVLKNNGIIAKIIDVLDNALLEIDLEPENIDKIILVGGSSNISLFQKNVEKYFSKKPMIADEPSTMVGNGAGIYCGLKIANNINFTIIKRISNSIKIKNRNILETMLEKNSKYTEFSDVKFFKGMSEIKLYKGTANDVTRCEFIGSIPVDFSKFDFNNIGIQIGTDESGTIICRIFNDSGEVVVVKKLS